MKTHLRCVQTGDADQLMSDIQHDLSRSDHDLNLDVDLGQIFNMAF